ncbi:MAG: serine/threonine-protein kinase [Thermoguttaceae bacterium]|jgi:serine/threonine protein kinase|nr:serine/threonine-protein kinase [Thermoguttaceae bacterium]
MTQAFDPYYQWLGIPAAEQPPNHYRLMGLSLFEANPAVIENAADQRMIHLRTFQAGKHAAECQRLLNEVATARVTLLGAEKKAAYDAQLRDALQRTAKPRQRDGPPAKRPPPVPGARPRGAHAPSLAPTAEFELPVRELGEYRLTEKLGEGGMGAVYKGMHTKLGREVAVKVLTTARLGNEKAIARFEREMLAVGRLDHPNIVRAYDAREIEGTRFLVMELVNGLDLTGVLRHAGPLPVADACEVIRQAALGLQCAHENQLVHRDIKPGNLMLTTTGQVKILDLGLARFEASRPGEEMTSTGMALGTLDYMAPEQASDGHHIDIRADVYSLGCTLYKLLAGRAPFDQPRYAGVMDKVVAHAKHSPPAISRFRGDVPKEVAAILNRMMAKAPARRFQTPGEVADAVGPFCVGANLVGLLARAKKAPPQAAPSPALEDTRGPLSSSLTNFLQAITPGRRAAGTPAPQPAQNRRLVLGAAAAVAIILLTGALIWAIRRDGPAEQSATVPPAEEPAVPQQGALVLRLPDEQRASTDLRVNNMRVRIPDSEPWEIPSRPGTYAVRLARKGFEPYEETVRIEPGKRVSVKPEWVPTARLVFHWPVEAREGARLQVDGRPVPLPSDPDSPDEFEVPAQPGTRLVWADRRGYQPFSRTIELARGEAHRVAVEWHASAPAEADVAAVPSPPEPKPAEQPQPEPQAPPQQPEPEPQPQPASPGPTSQEVAAIEAIEALEAKWRAATEDSEQKVAAWDFTGAIGALESVRFDDEQLAARLARRAAGSPQGRTATHGSAEGADGCADQRGRPAAEEGRPDAPRLCRRVDRREPGGDHSHAGHGAG